MYHWIVTSELPHEIKQMTFTYIFRVIEKCDTFPKTHARIFLFKQAYLEVKKNSIFYLPSTSLHSILTGYVNSHEMVAFWYFFLYP